MSLLEGKVAFITGGARGQGRAHAIRCAQEGADVVVVDIAAQLKSVSYDMATDDDLRETVSQVEALGRRALSFTVDVRFQDQLDEAVSKGISALGKIDILIANAGIWNMAPFWELTDEAWEEMVGTNLTGVWKSAKAIAPHMMSRGSGSIVIISSVNGIEPGPGYAHYVAAKHGAIGLMKSMALELAPHGIRCNAISPGAIRTPMTDHQAGWNVFAGHDHGTVDDMIDGGYHYAALKNQTFLSPDVVADAAVFLNSDLAKSITGITLPVESGHLLLTGVNLAPVKE
ncbi:MAG TPA: mycofactocin-coupled SDR family oxidoreductase [Frankiaceae bacterium]|nr:mycofactocin-coupled SDR family oxidoreductase [Frankiaceae bacterium]